MVSGGTIGGFRKPSGKGSRLIILHVGGENGWINGAALVFQSKNIGANCPQSLGIVPNLTAQSPCPQSVDEFIIKCRWI